MRDLIDKYMDLEIQLEYWNELLDNYNKQRKHLEKIGSLWGPSDIKAINYSDERGGGYRLDFHDTLEKMGRLDELINECIYSIREIELTLKLVEKLETMEDIGDKIYYYRKVKKMKLYEIARIMGYSYDYIRKLANKKGEN